MFFTPLVSIVPSEVAAAALVIVGALDDVADPAHRLLGVLGAAAGVPRDHRDAADLLDRQRIGAGFISWVIIRSFAGKAREISPLLWIVAAGFLIYFARGPIQTLLGG